VPGTRLTEVFRRKKFQEFFRLEEVRRMPQEESTDRERNGGKKILPHTRGTDTGEDYQRLFSDIN
jgi:hypothetical protein